MTFKELIELYRSGKASDMQKKVVEDEVEKFEAVSDYVYSDRDDGELTISTGSANSKTADPDYEESATFVQSVRKQIKHSFLRMGAYIIIIVIVIIVIQAFLPYIVDKFYYDPTKEIVISDTKDEGPQTVQQIELDFAIYSQLHMPLERRSDAFATPQGYGKYNISITQHTFTNSEYIQPAVGGQIVRDELTLTPPDFLDMNVMRGNFTYDKSVSYSEELEDGTVVEIPLDKEYAQHNKDFLSEMEVLDKDRQIKAIISFKEPVSYEKMLSIEKKYDLASPWYAVKTTSEDAFNLDFGFSALDNKVYESYENNKYPYLFKEMDGHEDDEAYMKQYFLSMIKYEGDQKEFLKTFDPLFEFNSDIYQSAYDFVDKNGLNIYGIVTYVDKNQAKELVDDNIAYEIKFKDFGRQ